jgi:hypothetical protein
MNNDELNNKRRTMTDARKRDARKMDATNRVKQNLM